MKRTIFISIVLTSLNIGCSKTPPTSPSYTPGSIAFAVPYLADSVIYSTIQTSTNQDTFGVTAYCQYTAKLIFQFQSKPTTGIYQVGNYDTTNPAGYIWVTWCLYPGDCNYSAQNQTGDTANAPVYVTVSQSGAINIKCARIEFIDGPVTSINVNTR